MNQSYLRALRWLQAHPWHVVALLAIAAAGLVAIGPQPGGVLGVPGGAPTDTAISTNSYDFWEQVGFINCENHGGLWASQSLNDSRGVATANITYRSPQDPTDIFLIVQVETNYTPGRTIPMGICYPPLTELNLSRNYSVGYDIQAILINRTPGGAPIGGP